ncbi:metal ABC transporter solute-binding protein, Zn/Mn family [Actinacidiphila glaucinigra]|uniref:Zinc/manganese transport system substrate-binding protein n=1 Tax=Actinacidiphila glaucinigra TaxID=235986 RepID=A0A239GIN4_9ACTN|nr:zinc ABC transporter substrate-binding protein [Actinacidiphila glaucinigra]SNS69009.1 zinc/manganese transport system substrate-binding protein [Actinacidiphila glaucinigra]
MSRTPSRLAGLLAGAASLGLLAGCGGSSDEAASAGSTASASASKVTVVASTNVYGDIVERIGGDRVDVTSIISDPAQDPHSYEAGTRNQLALSKAKVVVENGGGYDDFVDRMLGSGNASPEVVNAVEVSGRTAPAGGELNEHVWYDFPSMGKVADRIADALGKADPDNAGTFAGNAAAFKKSLTALQDKEASLKSAHAGEGVAITEPVPLYLLEASGLANRTPEEFSEAVEEGDDVSAKVLQATLDLFSDRKVKALVYNEQTSGAQTEKVKSAADAAGVPVVPVTETLPAGKDYLTWMNDNVDALADALNK